MYQHAIGLDKYTLQESLAGPVEQNVMDEVREKCAVKPQEVIECMEQYVKAVSYAKDIHGCGCCGVRDLAKPADNKVLLNSIQDSHWLFFNEKDERKLEDMPMVTLKRHDGTTQRVSTQLIKSHHRRRSDNKVMFLHEELVHKAPDTSEDFTFLCGPCHAA